MSDEIINRLFQSKNCPDNIQKLHISLQEYDTLFSSFLSLKPDDVNSAYAISLQALSLQDYIGAMENGVGICIKQIENKKITLTDSLIKSYGSIPITRAEKKAASEPEVIAVKDQKAIAEAIYGILDNKVKILDKIFYFCREMYVSSKSAGAVGNERA